MILTKDNNTKENRKIFFQGVKEEQDRRKKNINAVKPQPIHLVPFWMSLKDKKND